jgi:hypothetical protein
MEQSRKKEALAEEDYKKLIVPVFQKIERQGDKEVSLANSFVGNGFFIKDYFITAAHVIEEARQAAYIKVGIEEIMLSRKDAVIWRSISTENIEEYANPDSGDIAVYRVDGVNSPLMLSDDLPDMGEMLYSCYFFQNNWHNAKGLVGDDKEWFNGNFFGWKTDTDTIHPTEGGSSGSPLFKNNIVYGILHAGNKEYPSICVFTAASFAKKLLYNVSNEFRI